MTKKHPEHNKDRAKDKAKAKEKGRPEEPSRETEQESEAAAAAGAANVAAANDQDSANHAKAEAGSEAHARGGVNSDSDTVAEGCTTEAQANDESGSESEQGDKPVAELPAPSPEEMMATMREQMLRIAADFENYRKRAIREQQDARRYGATSVLTDMLAVLDNLERALLHSEGETSAVVQGVRLVAKQFLDVLGRHGVKPFDCIGEPFNPENHEAIGQAPSIDKKAGTILEEALRGYRLHDRLLRPAKVIVAVAGATEASVKGAGDTGENPEQRAD